MRVFFLFSAMLFFLCGCVREVTPDPRHRVYSFGRRDKGKYEKIKDAKLALELSWGSKILTAGKRGEVIFLLKNLGSKPVTIEEWYKTEAWNLRLWCQVWFPGTTAPSPDGWIEVSPKVKRPALRFPRTIPPGGEIFVYGYLDFLENLVITPGAERRYFLKAELNLTSVKARCPAVGIIVKPGKISIKSSKSSELHNKKQKSGVK